MTEMKDSRENLLDALALPPLTNEAPPEPAGRAPAASISPVGPPPNLLPSEDSFVVLAMIARFLRVAGWGQVAVGAITLILGLATRSQGFLSSGSPPNWPVVVAGLIIGVVGLVVVALGESIGVLFAVERNTRAAALALIKRQL